MDPVSCPFCRVFVVPMATGFCPSCREELSACATAPGSNAAPNRARPGHGYNPAPADAVGVSAGAGNAADVAGTPATALSTNGAKVDEAASVRDWMSLCQAPTSYRVAKDVGCALQAAAVLLGCGIFMLYHYRNEFDGLAQVLLFTALPVLGGGMHRLFRCARRFSAPTAAGILAKDSRAPVLLLRAFRDDHHALPGYSECGGDLSFGSEVTRSFEEVLCDVFSQRGPVIAVGRPGETIAPLGAARLWIADEKWKRVVDALIVEARDVVMIMGELPDVGSTDEPTKGLVWELRRICALKELQKVIVVVPPLDEREVAQRWNKYAEMSNGLIPRYVGGEIFGAFNPDGSCCVERISAEEDGTYRRDADAYLSALGPEYYRMARRGVDF